MCVILLLCAYRVVNTHHLVYKKNTHLMIRKVKFAVCSEIKQNTVVSCDHNVEFLIIKPWVT